MRLEIKSFLISLFIASLVASIVVYFSGIPFWGALLIILVSMFINGVIAEKEDNAPGGFLNPNGDNPKWPIIVTFEDGTEEQYINEEDLECNLEFFNSTTDSACKVRDSTGKKVHLVLENLEILVLKTE